MGLPPRYSLPLGLPPWYFAPPDLVRRRAAGAEGVPDEVGDGEGEEPEAASAGGDERARLGGRTTLLRDRAHGGSLRRSTARLLASSLNLRTPCETSDEDAALCRTSRATARRVCRRGALQLDQPIDVEVLRKALA